MRGEAETYQAGPVCPGKECGFPSKYDRKEFGRFKAVERYDLLCFQNITDHRVEKGPRAAADVSKTWQEREYGA